MKQTPLVRKTPLRSRAPLVAHVGLSRSTPIRKVSPHRAREQRIYNHRRPLFLAAHPRCTFPGGCAWAATEVHHRKGRVGALFLDESHWSALCHDHHAFLTAHPAIAYEMGMSERRIGGSS